MKSIKFSTEKHIEDNEKYISSGSKTVSSLQSGTNTLFSLVYEIQSTNNFIVSFKLKAPVDNSFALYIRGANETTNRNLCRLGVSGGKYPSANLLNGTTNYFEPSSTQYTANTDVEYSMKYENGTVKLYVEDTLLITQSISFLPKYIGIGCFSTHSNLQVTYTDLKVKPL